MSETLKIDLDRSREFGEWTFTATQDKKTHGCVLTRIRHDGFSFANDVQVWLIWLKTKSGQEARPLVLGREELPAKGKIEVSGGGSGSRAAEVIKPYEPANSLTIKYESKKGLFEDDPELTLDITQTYIFTSSGNDPSHEPSGTLQAARFYPLLEFTFSHPRRPAWPLYFRADYRLQISIGRGLGQKGPFEFFDPPIKASTNGWADSINQAGIFADEADPGVTIDTIFYLAEKPLKAEVIGNGYIHGKSYSWEVLKKSGRNQAAPEHICWDNIHQWGASEKGYPTTPGAAHAAHCHWRWTPVAVTGSSGLLTRFIIKPQQYFGGNGVPGEPLIDSRISNQTLQFAITGSINNTSYFESKYKDKDKTKRDPFVDPPNDGKKPDNIEKGSALTTWFAIQAFQDSAFQKEWGGLLFTHGFYFAHGIEEVDTRKAGVGRLNQPIYKPEGVVTKWNRPERKP